MQCPSCDYEAPQSQFGEPLRCPDCGAFYEKALELKLRKSAAPAPPAPPSPSIVNARGLVPCRSCKAPISIKAAACPHCGAAPKKGTSVFTWVMAVIAGLWLIGYLSTLVNNPGAGSTASSTTSPSSQSALATAKAGAVLESYDWRKSAGGSLMAADFTVRNTGSVAIKDIEIECVHFGPSGTKIDSNKRTIFEIVEAGKTRVFKNFDMGFIHSQVETTRCIIKNISI